MFKLIIDDRERKVIPFFKDIETDIDIQVERINIGDYCIKWSDNPVIIIERKTWKDLAGSIKDGRKENVKKLLFMREKYPQCKIMYLIEGKPRHAPSRKFCRIPYKNLLSHLDHLMIRDNIHVIYSKSCEDSAQRMLELIQNLSTMDLTEMFPVADCETSDISGGVPEITDILKTKFTPGDLQTIYRMWECIPNITNKTASIFIDQGIHISDFLLDQAITEEEIYILKYPSGVIIGKRAKKIVKVRDFNLPGNQRVYIAMLSCIRGLSKNSAKIILNNFKMQDILRGDV